MNIAHRVFLITAASLVLGACASHGGLTSGSGPIKEYEGNTVYTQRNAWFPDGEHETTNYHVGHRIAVNTKVVITATGSNGLKFKVADGGKSYTIRNVQEYTKRDIEAIYHRYFDKSKVDLGQFSAKERRDISNGVIEKGMSKDAVLVARGYPPAHKTPSLKDDQWRFWQNRFATRLVFFKNGQVSRVKD